jgi:hypothetical protein
MQIPILNGIYTDNAPDFRTRYPRNLIPVPLEQGISKGYLKPGTGITLFGTGPGVDRGGINWNGTMFRAMGSKLVSVDTGGVVTVIGDIGDDGKVVTFDYSFDRLAIWSALKLWYWDGKNLDQVTDPDLGKVIDGNWIAGYFLSTDGTSLIVTDLNDPFAVNPLKYGSAESDPDPIMATDKLRNEQYALGRYSIEVFQNIGGSLFPFQRVEGAQIPRGIIGTHAYSAFLNTFAFVGSGRNEAPSVYLMTAGDTIKLATREIDTVLQGYTEQQLSGVVVEARVDKAHQHLWIHLPDQVLVYDAAASQALAEPVWFTMTTSVVGLGTYRGRGLVWCYGRWLAGDPTSASLGILDDSVSTHFGQTTGWEFGTQVLYLAGNDGIVHEIELVCLTGSVALGTDPVVWTSYTLDGQTWSQERPAKVGKQGDRQKRIAWREQGTMRLWRVQKFRGTSEAHLTVARLEAQVEPLFTRPRNA